MEWCCARSHAASIRTVKCVARRNRPVLTSEQVAALQKAFGGPRDSTGKSLYVGQPWDPGYCHSGWRQWKDRHVADDVRPMRFNSTLMAGALAHEFITPPDPSFAITHSNFESRFRNGWSHSPESRHVSRRTLLPEIPHARRQAVILSWHQPIRSSRRSSQSTITSVSRANNGGA
jgi:feruloyl esterase